MKGKQLTHFAWTIYGIKRKVWFWIFKESDQSLRERCLSVLLIDTTGKAAEMKPRFWP